MKNEDFEQGRRYISSVGARPVCCVGHTTAGIPLIEIVDGSVHVVRSPELWKEYQEPLVRWCYLFGESLGRLCAYETEEEARRFSRGRRVFKMVEQP